MGLWETDQYFLKLTQVATQPLLPTCS